MSTLSDYKQNMPYGRVIDAAGESAPWITLVHGASQDHRLFAAQIDEFRQDYRLLLIDLPGHGKSAAAPGPYGLEEYAAGVMGVMDRTGVAATHYWGTHTGSGVGLLLAPRQPARFLSLVLEGAILPGVDLPSVTRELERARALARSNGIEAAREHWFNKAPWFQTMREDPRRCRAAEHWAMISEFSGAPWLDDSPAQAVAPVSDRLSSIEAPVMLMNGEHDLADFIGVADELERKLPSARRARIPDAGCFPLWEFPERVNPLVREFLAQHG